MMELGRQIVQQAATGLAIDRVKNQASKVVGPDQPDPILEQLITQNLYLKEIAESLSPQVSPDERINVTLQPFPYTWRVPQYTKAHFCIFAPASTPIRFDIPDVGIFNKTVGPGWIQADLDGGTEMSSGDSSNRNVTIVFCEDARGVAL